MNKKYFVIPVIASDMSSSALVVIATFSEDDLTRMRALRQLFEEILEKHTDLWHMTYRAMSCARWFGNSTKLLELLALVSFDLEQNEPSELPAEPCAKFLIETRAERAECSLIHTDEVGLMFSCRSKHTDETIASATLMWKELFKGTQID